MALTSSATTTPNATLNALRVALPSLWPYEVVDRLWYECGYYHHLKADPHYRHGSESYQQLAFLAAQQNHLYSFIKELEGRIARARRTTARPDRSEYQEERDWLTTNTIERVQVLTIHKAKGLEFPFVILADADSRAAPAAQEPYWFDTEIGLLFNVSGPNPLYQRARAHRVVQEKRELLRILYVALTRAESHIIVSTTLNRRTAVQSDTPESLWQLLSEASAPPPDPAAHTPIDIPTTALPQVALDALHTHTRAATPPQRHHYHRTLAAYQHRPVAHYHPREYHHIATEINKRWLRATKDHTTPAHPTPPASAPPSHTSLPIDTHIKSTPQATAFGNLCHLLLSYYLSDTTRLPVAPYSTENALLLSCTTATTTETLSQFTPALQSVAVQSALQLVAQFFADPLYTHLHTIKSELPFHYLHTATPHYHYIYGTIDCVALPQRTTDPIYIIDFKSDTEYRPTHYTAQLACYREAARRHFGRDVLPVIYWLRHARAQHLTNHRSMERILSNPALYQT